MGGGERRGVNSGPEELSGRRAGGFLGRESSSDQEVPGGTGTLEERLA